MIVMLCGCVCMLQVLRRDFCIIAMRNSATLLQALKSMNKTMNC